MHRKDVAGPAGLIATVELTILGHPSEETPELGLIVGELMLGVSAPSGSTAIITVSLWASIPT